MLSNPRPGQRCQLWYGPRYLPHARPGLHGACGVVVAVGGGRKPGQAPGTKGSPRNVLVRLDSGETVIVPGGNLRLPTTHEQQPALLLTKGRDVGDKA